MAALESARRIGRETITAEAAWADWLAELRPDAWQVEDFLQPSQRLVVVSPHPDDEVLACGGLIALHLARGGAAAVVAVTDGEASHRDDPRWTPPRLAAARRIERQRGLERLGFAGHGVTRLALADGAVTAQYRALDTGLRQILRPGDCVVSTWRGDGHPDHDACGSVSAAVCADIGCRFVEAPVWMWQWGVAGDPRVPWHRLRQLALPKDVLARKAAALAAHRTQLASRADHGPVLGPAILARAARGAEYFFV